MRDPRPAPAAGRYPVVLPSLADPRLHVSAVVMSVHVLGQVALDFAVSVPQIAAAIVTCAAIELAITFVQRGALVWPASAILTGSGVALILRDVDTVPGDHWTFQRWWVFAAVAGGSLATKYVLRWRGDQVFNPSNVGLVAAFLVLGSDRIEPLDFWWGPLDPALVVTYTLIVAAGLLITDRLRLLAMTASFWAVLAGCLALVAASGHEMSTPWSLTPVGGWHFWWVVVASPETLIFAFFMITDPRVVPTGPRGRVVFGAATAVASALLIAPQTTEFGAKVGLLGGLVITCAVRAVMRSGARAVLGERLRTRRAMVAAGAGTTVVVVAGLIVAGIPARVAEPAVDASGRPDPTTLVPPVDPDRLPPVTVDPDVAVFGRDLTGSGARQVAEDLLVALDVETLALREGRADLLATVGHGARLRAMTARAEEATTGAVETSSYRFDRLHLTVVRVSSQGGARLAAEAEGTVLTSVPIDGESADRVVDESPFSATFVLRSGSDGRWLIADVRDVGADLDADDEPAQI